MFVQALSSKRPSPQRRLRLAVIGNPGSAYLRAGVCASAVRRGFLVNSFVGSSSDYLDNLMDEESDLNAYNPDTVLLAIDPAELRAAPKPAARFSSIAKQHLGASLIQRTILSLLPNVIDTDDPVPEMHASLLNTMQLELRTRLDKDNIHLSFPEERGESGVLMSWCGPPIWRRRKQDAPSEPDLLNGNHMGRLLSAFGQLSYECFVFDISKDSQVPRYDLAPYLAKRYGTGLSGLSGINGALRLDLLLLVDQDPLTHKRLQQRPVYTMRRQREP